MSIESNDLNDFRNLDPKYKNDVRLWLEFPNNKNEGVWGTLIEYSPKHKRGMVKMLNNSILDPSIKIGKIMIFQLIDNKLVVNK